MPKPPEYKQPVPADVSLPLKWHGGKQYLADRIIAMMPKHVHYVEPYFGGGAVLFRKPCEGISEVVNDVNQELTEFWTVLQHRSWFQDFVHYISLVPFSEVEWNDSGLDASSPAVRAGRFFIRYRQSRQGLGKDFATLSKNRTRRGMNEQVSSWLSAIEGLPEAHKRLQRVVILCSHAPVVIQQEDSPNTLFYLDPPYLQSTRTAKWSFKNEMSESDHQELLDTLIGVQGKFLLSGYHSPMYDVWAERNGFSVEEIQIDNKASGANKKRTMTECVWRNF